MVDTLLDIAKTYLPADRLGIIDQAYQFAAEAHDGQMRRSGEPFIEHPLQTALFLAELKLDSNALAAALLHDVVEDCDEIALKDIENEFGLEIAGLVDGVTKLTKAEVASEQGRNGFLLQDSEADLEQAASLRKMLVSMASDVRVVLIKLADRLHNMRTLHALSPPRRRAIAKETLEIFAPLAHRLGIWEIKWRLEDLAFQHLNNGAYQEISGMLNAKRIEREEYIEGVRSVLQAELDKAGLSAEVTGRPKHIYSIHKKTEKYRRQNLGVDDIHDLFALRVLVDSVKDCYLALGVVHSNWRPLPGQFDDYIANPKDNLYKSLHTSVLCIDAHPVEVQIRTHEMHRLAEYGVAAHWLYKEGRTSDTEFEQKMTWLRQILDWQRDVNGSQEFMESFKTDIFKNQVYVYTPKGDLKELPAGATPLDFAFRIHTDVGYRCIGAKVNGKLVALTYQLQNGDTVEIMTSKTVRGPSLDWLNPNLGYLNSNSARTKVRQWFNRQERRANIERGKDIFRRQLRRLNTAMDDVELAAILKFNSVEEFLAALGGGDITVEQVVDRITNQEITPDDDFKEIISVPASSPASGVEVLGVGDLLTRMANCCTPIHGDSIRGYITRTRGVTVHRSNCPNILAEQETERLIPVGWSKAHPLYPVRVRLEARDRVGLLRDITSLVSGEGVNIASCVSQEEEDISVVSLTVYVDGISQLNRLFSKMESVRGVVGVSRTSV